VHFEPGLSVGDRGADLEHVSTEDFAALGVEIIGVIFHEGGAAFEADCHDFHRTHEGCGFPVTFSAEAVAIGHEPLNRQTRQLQQAVQVFKGRGKGLEAAFFEEVPHTGFNAGSFAEAVHFGGADFHLVIFFVLINQSVDFRVFNFLDNSYEVANTITVDRIAELLLGFDLVAFGDGHFTHVVAKASDFHSLHIVPGAGGSHPDTDAFLDFFILPVADDDLAVQTHPSTDKPEFAVAVSGLIEVHEVHIDTRPGQVAIELGMQMQEGFLEILQAGNPHLGRREGVHPGDQTNAVWRGVGFDAQVIDFLRAGQDGFENHLAGNRGGITEGGGDFFGIFGNLLEGFGTIKVLASGDEPDFKLLETGDHL